jgi:hypothetical protein
MSSISLIFLKKVAISSKSVSLESDVSDLYKKKQL